MGTFKQNYFRPSGLRQSNRNLSASYNENSSAINGKCQLPLHSDLNLDYESRISLVQSASEVEGFHVALDWTIYINTEDNYTTKQSWQFTQVGA